MYEKIIITFPCTSAYGNWIRAEAWSLEKRQNVFRLFSSVGLRVPVINNVCEWMKKIKKSYLESPENLNRGERYADDE